MCLTSDALSQHLPSYLVFSFLGHAVSLHGCSSKVQPLLLTLDDGYLLMAAPPEPWMWSSTFWPSCPSGFTVFFPHPFCSLGGSSIWTPSHGHSGSWPSNSSYIQQWWAVADTAPWEESKFRGLVPISLPAFLGFGVPVSSPMITVTTGMWPPIATGLSHWVMWLLPSPNPWDIERKQLYYFYPRILHLLLNISTFIISHFIKLYPI